MCSLLRVIHSSFLIIIFILSFNYSAGHTCDFDNSTSWYQKDKKDSGFIVVNYRNLKTYNAPVKDITTSKKKGNYAYMNNTSSNNKGQLQSPWFGSSGPHCTLILHTVITGVSQAGSISISIITNKGISRLVKKIVGNQGYKWQKQEMQLGQIAEPFRIELDAIVIDRVDSYIAVDNITLQNCSPDNPDLNICTIQEFRCNTSKCISLDHVCNLNLDCLYGEDEDQDCDALPKYARCTFDFLTVEKDKDNPQTQGQYQNKRKKKDQDLKQALCGWHNIDVYDTFNWSHGSGPTQTDATGPQFDHTTKSNRGHYLFIDASNQNIADRAILESVVYPPPPPQSMDKKSPYYGICHVRFFYHMFGQAIYKLVLQVKEVCPVHTLPRSVWEEDHSMMDELNNDWQYAAVPLTNITDRFVIHFSGFTAHSSTGDIAIDDVSLSPECFGLGVLKDISRRPNTRYKDWLKSIDDDTNQISDVKCFQHESKATTLTVSTSPYEATKPTDGHMEKGFPGGLDSQPQTYRFTTCGNKGQYGPIQHDCKMAYEGTTVHVTVADHFEGAQKWLVPLTADYNISVYGAQGGGARNMLGTSGGGFVQARYSLTGGDYIYILVGQEGSNACRQAVPYQFQSDLCPKNLTTGTREHLTPVAGAGGGGGTFVFKVDPLTNLLTVLMVAGGGGGVPYDPQLNVPDFVSGGFQHGGLDNALTAVGSPGGGGGWNGTALYPQAGRSLLERAMGGSPCSWAEKEGWTSDGGFGGGGGGCFAAGGGGGYIGGNVSLLDSESAFGGGGSSYCSAEAKEPMYKAGVNRGDGYVEITLLFTCDCQYWCSIIDAMRAIIECKCPPNMSLSSDGRECIEKFPASRKEMNGSDTSDLGDGDITAIAITGVVVALLSVGVVVCVGKCQFLSMLREVNQKRRKRQLQAMRLEMFRNGLDIQVSNPTPAMQTATSTLTNGMVMEYNPNYDFVVAKYPEHQLRELPRHNLRLSRGLGQGAFGEVYQGYLACVPHVEGELPVAVKTLPALCTELSEMDFYMEAVIMSKFNHPNIVKFLGVCFEEHPRYIILELLEGGDLKTFLRELRPKPDCPSVLCVKDLLKLALDIAKGCQHLEESHFIHRDIAARNCLLTCKGPERVAKIADFGMARDIYRADYYKKGGKAMLPIKWMPPEAFLDGIFTTKSDTWSYGILLWEIFAMGYMPYPGRTNQDVMQFVTTGGRLEPPDNCPSVIYQLMAICWAAIPETRPTFTDIMEQLDRFSEDPVVLESRLPDFRHYYMKDGERQLVRPKTPQDLLTICSKSVPNKKYNSHKSESCEPLIGLTRLSDITEERTENLDDFNILNDDEQGGELAALLKKGSLYFDDTGDSLKNKSTFTDETSDDDLVITDYLTPYRRPLLQDKSIVKSEPPISEMTSVLPKYVNICSDNKAACGLNVVDRENTREQNGFCAHFINVPDNDALQKKREKIQKIFEHKV